MMGLVLAKLVFSLGSGAMGKGVSPTKADQYCRHAIYQSLSVLKWQEPANSTSSAGSTSVAACSNQVEVTSSDASVAEYCQASHMTQGLNFGKASVLTLAVPISLDGIGDEMTAAYIEQLLGRLSLLHLYSLRGLVTPGPQYSCLFWSRSHPRHCAKGTITYSSRYTSYLALPSSTPCSSKHLIIKPSTDIRLPPTRHMSKFGTEYTPHLWPVVALGAFDRLLRIARLASRNMRAHSGRLLPAGRSAVTYCPKGDVLRIMIQPSALPIRPRAGHLCRLYLPAS
jgi:hypothetical protein